MGGAREEIRISDPQRQIGARTAYGEASVVWLRGAAANLSAHVDELNALNVFPVPDGDTGTNMAATARAALQEVEAVPAADRSLPRIAAALRFGALMGARGNSGVILSQIFRGMAEVAENRTRVSGADLAAALQRGSENAYASLGQPIEGTILTVARESADAAVAAAGRDPTFHHVLATAVDAARDSTERTPTLLPILREAGVVDSGGQGLFRLLEGALRAMRGQPIRQMAPVSLRAAAHAATETDGFGYETMFLLTAADEPLELERIRADLMGLGESVLVAGDELQARVHVHNDQPDRVIGYGLSIGSLTRITVENLDSQALEVAQTGARAFGGVGLPGEGLRVVAIAPGPGLAKAFKSAGASIVIAGGQSANPSAGQIADAIRAAGGNPVVVLPNNPNVRLAAQQAVALVPGVTVVVVPTRTAPEGLSALLSLRADGSAEENAEAMAEAARRVQTLAVAVRDASLGDRSVQRGEVIVLDAAEGLVAADRDQGRAIEVAVRGLQPGFELLTLYHGEGVSRDEAEGLAAALAEAARGAELEIVDGGQPHYSYFIAAE